MSLEVGGRTKGSPLPAGPRTWSSKRWLVAGIVVIVLVVAAPLVYTTLFQSPEPARLELSATGPAPAPTARGVPVAGTWDVARGSQVGYRVKETFFGAAITAVGRTSAVTGSISIAGTAVTGGSFTAQTSKVASDQPGRDQQFRGRIMDTSTYPTARFALSHPIQLGSVPERGSTISAPAMGHLTLRGTTRPVSFRVSARYEGSRMQVSGSIPITFAHWKIPNPDLGPITTGSSGSLEFLLDLSHT